MEELGKCPVCGRVMTADNSNMHHLLPKLKGGKRDDENMVRLHVDCHNKIHSIWSENELRDTYNNMRVIMLDPRMQKFAKWIAKQPITAKVSTRMMNNHKRKKR